MIVKIRSELFNDESCIGKVDTVLDLITRRRYDLFLDDEDIMNSHWIGEARGGTIDFLKEALSMTIQSSHKPDIELSLNEDIKNKVFSIDKGLKFLEEKVFILVENSYYDQFFIKGLILKFKKKSKKIKKFLDNSWIKFENCGGKNNTNNTISSLLSIYENIGDDHNYLKAIVFLDSDKKSKDDSDASRIADLEKIIEFCNPHNIMWHILEKREMENYLPIEVLEGISELNQEEFKNLKKMPVDERDFFDIEKLSTSTYKTKRELPKIFIEDFLTQEMLTSICVHQDNKEELQEILNKINSLL
ncbi:hypothetical protein [Elizabethkingia anophelis]|uniref:hypothetical protein n=1 Tax=Elizabethkingia anophelis TaxID=1117645 RepID=UPI0008406136|nr:hypothetical protein [Elizabethkingia anophelis]MVW81854.1 hypothetical protein [Elizabethkingia anophelis]OCW75137.1 hypothetical protein A4G24_08690 [Elizabethkingia anophelis]